jgi:hypothetical protein
MTQVYVIGSPEGDAVKIRHSNDPTRRLATLQAGSPIALSVLAVFAGGRQLESALHRWFAPQRLHGEWFQLGPEAISSVREAVDAITAGVPIPAPKPEPAPPEALWRGWPNEEPSDGTFAFLTDEQLEIDRSQHGNTLKGWSSE